MVDTGPETLPFASHPHTFTLSDTPVHTSTSRGSHQLPTLTTDSLQSANTIKCTFF